MSAPGKRYRLAPDVLMLAGALVALLGYLLPWFKVGSRYQWWYSGWSYLTLSSGGGWAWWTVFFLVVAIGASVWAGRSVALRMLASGAGTAAMFFASAVVAVSLGAMPQSGSINWVGELPFGIGLPLMAIGFGVMIAGTRRPRPDPGPPGVAGQPS